MKNSDYFLEQQNIRDNENVRYLFSVVATSHMSLLKSWSVADAIAEL